MLEDSKWGRLLLDAIMAVLLLFSFLAVFRMWAFPIAGFLYVTYRWLGDPSE